MKKLLLLFACSLAIVANAQNTVNITSSAYSALKANGQLDATKNYIFTDVATRTVPIHYKGSSEKSASSICSCMVPLDSTFLVVPFSGGTPPDYRVDDASATISIPFSFNFYGTNYSSVFINSNGTISFNNSYVTFISTPFPSTNYKVITPFWADIYTMNSGSGLIYYKVTPTHIIVKWDHVYPYGNNSGLNNTFQVVLTDGTDPILPAGKNVGYCYGDMQWTSASGTGGVAATAGVNKDSTHYFQIGRFSQAGVAFDGPYGLTDGIDWLDNQGMYLNTSYSTNIPPVIINNNICDTIDVYTGDTTHTMLVDSVRFTLGVSTPEVNQTVNATISSPDASSLSYTLTQSSATYKEYACSFRVLNLATGLHYVTVTATDDGTPAAQTSRNIYIRSHYDPSLTTTGISENNNSASISLYPNPTSSTITVKHGFGSSASLSITNVVGQMVMTSLLTSQEQTIDISKLTKGIYFATIVSKEGNSKTIKLVRK
ncbi:MAG: nidogen-like domain-containing protein [Bacteroidota bacterium]